MALPSVSLRLSVKVFEEKTLTSKSTQARINPGHLQGLKECTCGAQRRAARARRSKEAKRTERGRGERPQQEQACARKPRAFPGSEGVRVRCAAQSGKGETKHRQRNKESEATVRASLEVKAAAELTSHAGHH